EIDGKVGPKTKSAIQRFFRDQAALAQQGAVSEHGIGSFDIQVDERQLVRGMDELQQQQKEQRQLKQQQHQEQQQEQQEQQKEQQQERQLEKQEGEQAPQDRPEEVPEPMPEPGE